MAFWHIINLLKQKLVSHQLRRCYVQGPDASFLNYTCMNSRSCALENPIQDNYRRATDSFKKTRFFATSFQGKARKEDKDAIGPRLNENITAKFVRLVTDEGHSVVSLSEAWDRARKLKLDLVEVQGNVDPPVCKIMDYQREQYKRKVQEKDRAREKKDVTIKKGACKEVRFLEKTELKDLKIKADTVVRLMQRGYRVKCMALGAPKKGGRALKKGSTDEGLTEVEIAEMRRQEEEEKEALRVLLSRLTDMLGDEFIVESGPNVEKKQAYVIVRHAKFGPSKKSGAKKIKKDVEKVIIANHSGPIQNSVVEESEDDEFLSDKDLDDETSWSVADSTTDYFDRVFDFSSDAKESIKNGTEMLHQPNLNTLNALPQPYYATENRYKRTEPRERLTPATSSRDSFRITPPQFSNQSSSPQSEGNVREKKPIPVLRTGEMHKQHNPPGASTTKASGYGIFSSTKATNPGKQGLSQVNNNSDLGRNSNGGNSKSEGGQRATDGGNGQARWGIFSKDVPNVNPNRTSK